jgi:hypothetical protein
VQESGLEWLVAMHEDRELCQHADLLVDVVTPDDPHESPATVIQEPAEVTTRDLIYTVSSITRPPASLVGVVSR